MGFTVKRPRRRPRARSVCFRAVWWLVTREAAARIVEPRIGTVPPATAYGQRLRSIFAKVDTYQLRRQARRWLELDPERRIAP